MHFSCALYEGAKWCTSKRKRGKGWQTFWGGFNGFKKHGMNAFQACCGCGGGNRNPAKFDNTLPVYDGVPAYPYQKVHVPVGH